MREIDNYVWVLENFPLGEVLAEFLGNNLTRMNLLAHVVSPELYPEILNVNFREADDEAVQAAFLANIARYSQSGITIAVLHINSQKTLDYAQEISKKGIKTMARIPSKSDVERDVEIKTVKRSLEQSEIPYVDYGKLGIRGYQNWVLNQVIKVLGQ